MKKGVLCTNLTHLQVCDLLNEKCINVRVCVVKQLLKSVFMLIVKCLKTEH